MQRHQLLGLLPASQLQTPKTQHKVYTSSVGCRSRQISPYLQKNQVNIEVKNGFLNKQENVTALFLHHLFMADNIFGRSTGMQNLDTRHVHLTQKTDGFPILLLLDV